MPQRSVYACLGIALLFSAAAPLSAESSLRQPTPPNVLMILTDDQGYGELSCHGNPVLQTPNLDRLHAESVRLTDFHVAPMCTPTRGQLMTGVDCLRNLAMNVSSGRTLLRRDLPTMADLFAAAGYATGIFGKWHLGDNYPYRPQDRGFHETLWYPSSHIGSAPDFWDNDYFDDTYWHNGRRRQFTGYTTDVFFREAMRWMREQAQAGQPFLLLPAHRRAARAAFRPGQLPRGHGSRRGQGQPAEARARQSREQLARYLAMIANIDENVGRLEAFLRETGLRDNTILVFLTDNGSTFGPRYFNAGMRGGKVTLWEGGHRVPCFIRWPAGGLRPAGDVTGLTQVQDLLPTLLELAGVKPPAEREVRRPQPGRRAARDERAARRPHAGRAVQPHGPPGAAAGRRLRAVAALAAGAGQGTLRPRHRPGAGAQRHRGPSRHRGPAARATMRQWWASVAPRLNEPQRVTIGHDAEPLSLLSPCEWRDVFLDQGAQVRRGERKNGVWHLEVARAGEYEFELRRWPREREAPLGRRPAAAEDHRRRIPRRRRPAHRQGPAEDRRLRPDRERGGDGHVGEVPRAAARGTGRAANLVLRRRRAGKSAAPTTSTCSACQTSPPVKLILDTDMSGDCDDAGALALLHALADRGECELLATVANRKDKTNASAAAVDAINTYYGRPDIPIGTDKQGPTDLQRTSLYAPALRDEFPNDIGPDDRAPDALDVYRRVLAAQPDGSVTICSVGALSNLAELWRRAPELVRAKVQRLVVMGGEFPHVEEAGDQHPHPSRGGAGRRGRVAGRNRLARLRNRQRADHRRAAEADAAQQSRAPRLRVAPAPGPALDRGRPTQLGSGRGLVRRARCRAGTLGTSSPAAASGWMPKA